MKIENNTLKNFITNEASTATSVRQCQISGIVKDSDGETISISTDAGRTWHSVPLGLIGHSYFAGLANTALSVDARHPLMTLSLSRPEDLAGAFLFDVLAEALDSLSSKRSSSSDCGCGGHKDDSEGKENQLLGTCYPCSVNHYYCYRYCNNGQGYYVYDNACCY